MQKNGEKIKSGLPIGDVKNISRIQQFLCHINSITIVVNVENTQNKTKIAFPYIPYDKDNFIAYSE